MISILIAAAVGLFATLLGTPVAIRAFRFLGWGQRVREPTDPRNPPHREKMGTPTMGGLVILAGMILAYAITRMTTTVTTYTGVLVIGVAVALGVLGFVDDYVKVHRHHSLGIGKTTKLIVQAVVAVGFTLLLSRFTSVSREISFIRDTGLHLGVLFTLWVFLMVASTSNAVNLTDGLDGLASGSVAMVMGAYVIIGFWQFRHTCQALPDIQACYEVSPAVSLDVAIVAAAAMGAVAGFLWWNAAPAKIFMGDTGSLALGGLIAATAIVTRTQLLLVILGGLFVLETVSVILQVISFRVFKRRLFRMAPIHHHFEVLGWPEFTVIVRFWIIAGLAVAFGLGLFYAEFLSRGGQL
ncbi:MAG TPA: phospho-N-acetylmuramoyl-pentapeptide-transferase [Actinomycetota bacterium]